MYKQINHMELEDLIKSRDGLILADVRDIESFNEGHIKNAIHLSMSTLQDFCTSVEKTQAILVYCYHGVSSQSVAQHLIEQGFSEIYSLIGGFEVWKAHHPTSDASN